MNYLIGMSYIFIRKNVLKKKTDLKKKYLYEYTIH